MSDYAERMRLKRLAKSYPGVPGWVVSCGGAGLAKAYTDAGGGLREPDAVGSVEAHPDAIWYHPKGYLGASVALAWDKAGRFWDVRWGRDVFRCATPGEVLHQLTACLDTQVAWVPPPPKNASVELVGGELHLRGKPVKLGEALSEIFAKELKDYPGMGAMGDSLLYAQQYMGQPVASEPEPELIPKEYLDAVRRRVHEADRAFFRTPAPSEATEWQGLSAMLPEEVPEDDGEA